MSSLPRGDATEAIWQGGRSAAFVSGSTSATGSWRDAAVTRVRLLHGFTHFHDLGGVQSMLRKHRAEDAAHGIDSEFLAYFEPWGAGSERVAGLGLNGRSTVRSARGRFAATRPRQVDLVAYHNCWGVALFTDLDGAARRIGVMHTDFPGLSRCLGRLAGSLDGMLCVSEPLLKLARRELPELVDERLEWLPYPVPGEEYAPLQAALAARPLVLGFAGRLATVQKRVDRFPELLRRLGDAGVKFRFEFLGTGPEEDWLRAQFPSGSPVVFHGMQTGEAYQSILRQWDVIAYVSDYEGLPITLLEALSHGVIPLYPRIDSGGDHYAATVFERLLYPPGDLGAAVSGLQALARLETAAISDLRQRCLELARPHRGDCYLGTFERFVRRIGSLPQISAAASLPRRARLTDWIPFGLLKRVAPRALWRTAQRNPPQSLATRS